MRPSQQSPWLVLKICACVHALLPLGWGAYLIASAMRRPRPRTYAGSYDVAAPLMLIGGAVLVVWSIPYVIAASGILRQRCWAATLFMICTALQGAGEALLVMKTLLFIVLATGGIFNRRAGPLPFLQCYAVVVAHVVFLVYTLWEAMRVYGAEHRVTEPPGFAVIARQSRRRVSSVGPLPVLPMSPTGKPKPVIPIPPPSSQFRADNHYDSLTAHRHTS